MKLKYYDDKDNIQYLEVDYTSFFLKFFLSGYALLIVLFFVIGVFAGYIML